MILYFHVRISCFDCDTLFCCSFEQINKPSSINPDVQRQTIEALLTKDSAPVEKCLKPEFIRLAPPLHLAEDQVIIVNDCHSVKEVMENLDAIELCKQTLQECLNLLEGTWCQ